MTKTLEKLLHHLKEGKVYRRAELANWSNAVDRHIAALVTEGFLEKLSGGLYYVPQKNAFGTVPPDDESLIRTFLKEDDFLLTSPNLYNSLGVGTTQLYNKRIVYNHKRHGEFELGGRKFFFHAKHRFPKTLTAEFLLVDLMNNLDNLAEDKNEVLKNVLVKTQTMNARKLKQALLQYGNAKTKTLLTPSFRKHQDYANAV